MSTRFNPPPGWPRPPDGWVPEAGWQPDPAWGAPPPGWTFWVEGPSRAPSEPRPGGPRVFISYRRADCQPQANGLYDGLTHRLPRASIFMDIDSIPYGVDFEQHIRSEIEICDVVLVLIGDDWLDASDPGTGRRIDAADDFVRLEIESAFASPQVRVLPVLVEGATMPRATDLPPSIRALARLNAVELDDRRWTSDVGRLAGVVEAMTSPVAPDPVRPLHGPGPAPTPDAAVVPPSTAAPKTPVAGWVMVCLPVLTLGLASFVPAVWAAVRRRRDARYFRSMLIFAVVIGAATYTAFVGIGAGDTGSVVVNVGVAAWLACIVVATVVAAINRNP